MTLTLALGLGVNAAMLTLLDRVYFRMPAGVTDPENLRRLWTPVRDKAGRLALPRSAFPRRRTGDWWLPSTQLPPPLFFACQPQIRLDNDPDDVTTTVVRASAEYLPLLGVRAAVGRFFTADEARLDSPARVAVISDALWRIRFAADDTIIGKTLQLSGHPFAIIGVTSPGFAGIDLERTDVWIPLGKEPIGFEGMGAPMWRAGGGPTFTVLARLRDGRRDAALESRATRCYHFSETRPRRQHRSEVAIGSALVIAQVALSVVLLVGSGLFLRSLQKVPEIRLGYDVPRLLFGSVRYSTYRPHDSARFATAAERLRHVKGVEQVGMATIAPMGGGLLYSPFYTDTDSSTNDRTGDPSHLNVSSNYFAPRNPAVMIGVAGLLLAAAIVASIVPAIRASRVDPVVALRAE